MKRSQTRSDRYALALLGLAALAAVLGGGPAPSEALPGLVGDKVLADLAGEWKGDWEDTVYNVSGPVELTVTPKEGGYDAVGTIDLSSINSLWGVQSGTATGTIAGETLSFTFTADLVGNGSGTLNGDAGDGSGVVTGFMEFGAFTFTGTATGSEISGSFDFTSPSGGAGVVTLTRTVPNEAATWSDLKAAWR